MQKFFPFLTWIKDYNLKTFLADLPAGLTVGIMLIPQGMAYAMIAGLPQEYGLYAALVPQVIYALMGTSRQLAVGPVAMDSLLVAAGLSVIATVGTEYYILLAVTLAFVMGTIQFLMGAFKLGFLVNFLSKPVISGFTSAAALIIGFNQIKYLVGVDIVRSNQVHLILVDFFKKIDQVHLLTFGIGLAGIVLVKGMKKYVPKIPAALVLVVTGIFLVKLGGLDTLGVDIVGDIPSGLPAFTLPVLDMEVLSELLPVAVTLALIAFMEAISVSKAIEMKHTEYRVRPNQELIALGAANIIGSLFQAYPTSGGFSRTAVNDQAGAKTGVAAMVSAIVIGLTLLFLTSWFYFLPKALLASIIMVAVLGLVDFKYPITLFRNRKEEFFLLVFTFIVTLTVGITEGILIGVGLSLLLLIYRTTKPHLAILGRIEGTNLYRNIERFEGVETSEDTLIIRFDAQLYFANSNYFKEQINKEINAKGTALRSIIFSCEGINYMDSSAGEMLYQFLKKLKTAELNIGLAAATGPFRDRLKKSGIIDLLGENCMFNTLEEAVECINGTKTRTASSKIIANQTNI